MIRSFYVFAGALFALALWTGTAAAQQTGPAAAPTTVIDSHALPPLAAPVTFDPHKATDAYLAQVSGAARTRSNSYFEGGYVLILADALYAIAIAFLLLWFKVSASIRDFAERQTRSRFWQVPLYVGPFILVLTVLTFPMTLYEGFFREKSYGLMNQSFAAWFGDQLTDLGITLVVATIVLTLIYSAIRRVPRTWWLWGAAITVAFSAFGAMVAPVLIAPLFNHYSSLPASPLKADILSLARANGIPASDVFLVDASRQSDRISANVSGLLGTTRVTLNDNLMKRGTHDEVLAILGHEMGHYVLDHAFEGLVLNALVLLAGFAFMNWGYRILAGLFGGNWDVRTIDDPAGLPLLFALFTLFGLLMTPVNNTITRTYEIQADMFGINAARKPDAFATAVLKLSTYRKLDPSPWEETIFYDHPSGRTRIWEMMRWKAEHLNDPDIKAGSASPQ